MSEVGTCNYNWFLFYFKNKKKKGGFPGKCPIALNNFGRSFRFIISYVD